MSTNPEELTTFTIRAGERQNIQVDFTPSLESGDYLTGVPTVATATLRGFSTAGSLVLSNLAFESGDQPKRLSFRAAATTAHVEYRVDCVADTQSGERKIVPVRIKVIV